MQRRTLLKTAAVAGVAALASPRSGWAAEADIELNPVKAGPRINPHIYGHFIEHLGGVIYDGVWVGRDSKIPNIDGFRKQFVDDMKLIGPTSQRPSTYNYWESRMPDGLHAEENNHFGIREFIRLCRLIGAEPYVAANVGSGTPKEFHDWVVYANAPAGTVSLAEERAANGDREPFNIKYWGVGNESWGCGGNMTGGEYATKYRQFVTQFPSYVRPFLVATGPRGHSAGGDLKWTRDFFDGLRGSRGGRVDGLAMHYYTDFRRTNDDGAKFQENGWYAVLHKGIQVEKILNDQWRLMGEYDPEHHTKFVLDEWGNWYSGGTELAPRYILSQTITLRDALHAAMTFDIFNRNAEKMEMANVAQTINCLHSLFEAVEDKYTRTPAFYAFQMYQPHMGADSVPMAIQAPELTVPILEGTVKLTGLSGSASIRGNRICVTLTNPSLADSIAARIRLSGGAQIKEGRGTVLTHEDMTATNTFDNPGQVKLSKLTVATSGGGATVNIPAKAVVALELSIG